MNICNKHFEKLNFIIRSSLRDSIFGHRYNKIRNYMRSRMDHKICPEGIVLIKYSIDYKCL